MMARVQYDGAQLVAKLVKQGRARGLVSMQRIEGHQDDQLSAMGARAVFKQLPVRNVVRF